ncbi:hypothetical protein HW02_34135 [Pseudomonas aeruginosa]|nr:hypothetical protein HW02_34135 [Pseudomonas aeruginosa]
MLTDWAAYAGLFLSAFGSATLLPLQSETVLAALLLRGGQSVGHCCKVSDEAAFCLIQRPYISKTLLTRRISPRGSP